MKLTLNGEEKIIAQDTLTISTLLKAEAVKMPEMVSVELNGEMVEREVFDTQAVKEGDVLEFLYFMGGGQ
jgi:sulfur carrier protein